MAARSRILEVPAGAPLLASSLPFLGAEGVTGALFRRSEGGAFLLVERTGSPGAVGRYGFLNEPGGAWAAALANGFAEVPGSWAQAPSGRVFVVVHVPDDAQWVLVVELQASGSAESVGRALQGYLASRVGSMEYRALSVLPDWLRPDALALARRPGPILLQSEAGCGATALARAVVLTRFLRDDAAVFWEPARLSGQVQLRELFGEAAGRRLGGPDPTRVPLAEGPDRAVVILEAASLTRSAQLRLHSLLAGEEGRGRLWILQSCRDLGAMAKAGKFDPGLWSRLRDSVFVLPPLRALPDALPSEVQRLLARLGGIFRRDLECSPEALQALQAHHWPGNWEELARVLERAFLVAGGSHIVPRDLFFQPSGDGPAAGALDLRGRSEELEWSLLLEAYALHAGNQVHMARALGISRGSLQYKLEKHGLLANEAGGEGQEA